MSRAVLLLVDFFNPRGFDGALSRATVRAAQRAARLKARLRKLGVPAVYANDNFGRWESESQLSWTSAATRRAPWARSPAASRRSRATARY